MDSRRALLAPYHKIAAFLLLTLHAIEACAQTGFPDYYVTDAGLTRALQSIVKESGLDGVYDVGEDGTETISLAVIDLTGKEPVFAGVNADNSIYPASVYKMYVAMEVLKQATEGKYSLFSPYIVRSPNDVDRVKEIGYDPRPLLRHGDTVTLHYLLDLMITRSDNSAANCLIDIAGRPNINETMRAYNWKGSEVTRKFLSRKLEHPGYDTIASTMTCAWHAADFLYRMYRRELVNARVSMQLQSLLGMQLDTTKLSQGLPPGATFYHKTGWWSYYTHDAGIVDDGQVRYVIALFTPVPEEQVRPKLALISQKVHALIRNRHP